MYCRFCGKQIQDDSAYCIYCGRNLGSTVKDDASPDSNNLNFPDEVIKNASWEGTEPYVQESSSSQSQPAKPLSPERIAQIQAEAVAQAQREEERLIRQKAYEKEQQRLKEKREAEERREKDKIEWEKAQSINTYESYQWYMENFPDGLYLSKAAELYNLIIEENAWNSTKQTKTKESVEEFIEKYNYSGRFTAEAYTLLTAINKRLEDEWIEDELWEKAESTDSKESYNEYLDKYPNGKYAEDAHDNIEHLENAGNGVVAFWCVAAFFVFLMFTFQILSSS